jgi:hypothetical protein
MANLQPRNPESIRSQMFETALRFHTLLAGPAIENLAHVITG